MKKIILTCILITAVLAGRSQSISFTGNFSNNKLLLNWSTDSNELTDRFEVEKSYNGLNFSTAALIFTSEKKGPEEYKFHEKLSSSGKIYYRIKIYGYDKTVKFSKVISFSIEEKGVQTINSVRYLSKE
jgi:hypothetical protein